MKLAERLHRDTAFIRGVGRTLRQVTPMARRKSRTFPDALEELAVRYGDRPALLSRGEMLTFAGLNARANQYGRWALANGIGKGDVVCLLMPNRAEYPAIWLGIARVGGVVALLNTRLTGAALAYCIEMVAPSHLIVAKELSDAHAGAAPHLATPVTVWRHGTPDAGPLRIDTAVAAFDEGPIPKDQRPPVFLDDRCLYIYTSGTTGLPKAANVSHYRVYGAMLGFSAVMDVRGDDRLYNCLPLYHTSGGVIGIGACLMAGGSVFIGERYSETRFWDDVVDHNCSLFQYIGEMGRALVNAPEHPKESAHAVRMVCGSGMRPGVWESFTSRFGIAEVREFYGATEGNALIFNWDSTPGMVGRIPRWARIFFPVTTIRVDLDRAAPVRDADGLCIECEPGEVGEVVSRIMVDPLRPAQRFDGFVDRAETERRILRDVFVAGDMWFRSGDLMRRDDRGYFAFVDRLVDAFRCDGEPVWTTEVGDVLCAYPAVREANLYGVAAPGNRRVAMAAIVADDDFDLAGFRDHIYASLASHARPVFLRFQRRVDMTPTFRLRKLRMVDQGFDPARTDDPLFFDDTAAGRFIELDATLHDRIVRGEIDI